MSCKTCQVIIVEEAPYLESYFSVYVTQGRPPLPPSQNLILNGPRQYVTPPVTPPPPPPRPPGPVPPPEIPGPQDDDPGTPTGDPHDDAPTGPNTGGNTSNPGGPPPPPDTPNNPNNENPEVRDFGNVTVFFNNCTAGTVMQFTGSTPQWIMFNGTSLQGREGVFRGETQELANEAAQAEIDEFAEAAIANGDLTCVPSGSCPSLIANYPTTWVRGAVYNSTTDRIWVSRNFNGIDIVNPADGSSTTVTPGVIDGLVYASTPNRMFVSFYSLGYTIHYVDPVTGADLGTLGPGLPLPMYNATRNHVCTVSFGPSFDFYDASSLALSFSIIDIPDSFGHCPAYCPTTNKYYIGSDGVGIRVYNGDTGAHEATIASTSTFFAGVYAPTSGRIVICDYDGVNYRALFIDPNTDTITNTIILAVVPWDPRYSCYIDPVTEFIYVVGTGNLTDVIDSIGISYLCQITSGGAFNVAMGFASSNNTIWMNGIGNSLNEYG